jgi:hypothetical protein
MVGGLRQERRQEFWQPPRHARQGGGGKISSIAFNDDPRRVEIAAKIVDDDEWRKIEEGVYPGFSQGGTYVKCWPDSKTRVSAALQTLPANVTQITTGVDRSSRSFAAFGVGAAQVGWNPIGGYFGTGALETLAPVNCYYAPGGTKTDSSYAIYQLQVAHPECLALVVAWFGNSSSIARV